MPVGASRGCARGPISRGMARDLSCPVCSAHFPLAGDERIGDDVYCTYCGAPCILRKAQNDPDELDLEEDF